MWHNSRLLGTLACALGAGNFLVAQDTLLGFDLSNFRGDRFVLVQSFDARDALKPIDFPRFVSAEKAGFMAPTEDVLGVVVNGEARAYPVRILNYHEVVNDQWGTTPVCITYCPLSGSGRAFNATVNGRPRHFGVSGLEYNSNLVVYDRETNSLWGQLSGRAIAGPECGTLLEPLPLTHTTWAAWRNAHPETRVLTQPTGSGYDYTQPPYDGYPEARELYFPIEKRDRRLHPKAEVVGVAVNGESKAYVLATLLKRGTPLVDTVGGQEILIETDAGGGVRVTAADGENLPIVRVFWFAWAVFHRNSALWGKQ